MSRGGERISDKILEAPVSGLFFMLNLGIFSIAWTKGHHIGWSLAPDTLLGFGALERNHIWYGGDSWRLITAVFLHVHWLHLILNLFGIFPACIDIEKTVGSGWFAFAYLSTGIGASAVSVLFHPVFGAGASGAGYGMFAVTLSILYRREGSWNNFMSNPMARQIMIQLVLWTLVGYTLVRNMDNYAHLGGAAFGFPCGLLLEGRRGKKRTFWMAGLAAYILVWVGVVAAACYPRHPF